jgi:hypothetical protein
VSILESDIGTVGKMLTGVSALSLLDAAHMDRHIETTKRLFQSYLRLTAPDSTGAVAIATVQQKAEEARARYEEAWWLLRDSNAMVDTFGHSMALFGQVTAGDRHSMAEAVEGLIKFGATVAAQNPIQDALIGAAVTGSTTGAVASVEVPSWIVRGMHSSVPDKLYKYVPDAWDDVARVNVKPALIFTAIQVTSKTLPMLFEIGAVAEFCGPVTTGAVKGTCGMISAACDILTNSLTNSAVASSLNTWEMVQNIGQTFGDMANIGVGRGTVENLERHARAFGEDLFRVMYSGTDVNAVINAGVDTGQLMVNLFSGNTGALAEDARKMGASLVNIITSNRYAQIVGAELRQFSNVVYDTLNLDGEFARTLRDGDGWKRAWRDFGDATGATTVWNALKGL